MKKILRIAVVSILGLIVILTPFTIYGYFTGSEPKYTIREALWVSDRDMKHFYPPYSPQAQNIIAIFENRAVIQTNKKAYNEYVLYRMGLTAIDEPNESLLILGFQPSKE